MSEISVAHPVPATGEAADGDVGGIVDDMLRVKAAAATGQPFSLHSVLGDDAPEPPEPATPDRSELPEMTVAIPSHDVWIASLPAEVHDDRLSDRPGLTPRGWSPEVTARHPKLVAETMAELAGGAGPLAAGEDPIDPLDPVAVAMAVQEANFAPIRAAHLRHAAISLNNERLMRARAEKLQSTPAAQAAFKAAADDAQARLERGATTATAGEQGRGLGMRERQHERREARAAEREARAAERRSEREARQAEREAGRQES